MDKIGSRTFEEYCERVKTFHGSFAPGILVGGIMVDVARRNLPSGILYDVVCETVACLPDAVQLLTPCSIGNQWLKIVDVGRFAMTFYDKYTGDGVRVRLDRDALDRWPAIREWFLKLKPKQEQDKQRLLDEIMDAGTDICRVDRVRVSSDFFSKRPPKTVSICPSCNEAYRSHDGPVCPACAEKRLPYMLPASVPTGD